MAREASFPKLMALVALTVALPQLLVAPMGADLVAPQNARRPFMAPRHDAAGRAHRRKRIVRQVFVGGEECLRTTLVYQGDGVRRSLVADGQVGSKEGQPFGSKFVKKTVLIRNGRNHDLTLDKDGFTLVQDAHKPLDYFSEKVIVNDYYPEVCKLIKKVTGATTVLPFDHNLRSRVLGDGAKRRKNQGHEVLAPVMAVHNDYSEASAVWQVEQLAKPFREGHKLRQFFGEKPLVDPSELDDLLSKRWAFVKVWRNIQSEPIRKHPFALCAGPSIPLEDIIAFEAGYAKRSKDYYFAGHSKGHRWYYFPELTRDEAIIFKTWDSAGVSFGDANRSNTVPATFAFHTAFDDPDSPDWADERESLEVVTLACLPDSLEARAA